ncbi:MAG TPA: PQQ-binding-like beta-propeller repeat protein, partial [Burkholderiaceae bacterium]|nr:PQQ-binding-like beta-propeller repeat protein [Burkholderiaceae bacterium]
MTRKRIWLLAAISVALVTLAVGVGVIALSSEALAWRVQVIDAKLMGRLPQIPASNLIRWLAPGSAVYLGGLAENPNVHASVVSLVTDPAAAAQGKELFARTCATCHGDDALGRAGPNLVAYVSRNTDWSFFAVTKWGRKDTAMVGQPLDDRQIWAVHSYLRARSLASQAEAPQPSSRSAFAPPDAASSAERFPELWLTYGGNFSGHRHSSLAQIDKRTVSGLGLAWTAQLRASDTPLQASPIVSGGLIFVTQSRDGVVALDARTGEQVWEYRRPVPETLPLCCGSPNRGAAILGDTLFVGTLDAHLVALDAATGKPRWMVQVAEPREGYSITGAPLAIRDKVLIGVAGGEFGGRGFLAAFDAASGRQRWKFFTVPGPGEFGHDTWGGDSWKTGGAPTWAVGAYDAALNLVLWGVGNPSPPYSAEKRPGDNLFSNSVIALDADSGMLRWHFQFTPADEHDWDATQQPVLADVSYGQAQRSALLWANRNGFFYALDRATGKFLLANPFVKQNWASGLDANGKPIVRVEARPTVTGSLVWPAVGGATNWWPPSYDPRRGIMFVPFVEAASIYFSGDVSFERGRMFLGSTSQYAAGQPTVAGVKAIDAATGRVVWESAFARGGADVLRIVDGVLSTTTGVLFTGYRDLFYALDSDTGKELWRVRLGARVSGP